MLHIEEEEEEEEEERMLSVKIRKKCMNKIKSLIKNMFSFLFSSNHCSSHKYFFIFVNFYSINYLVNKNNNFFIKIRKMIT